LRDDGEGHAKWIDRHVEDLNRPYGLALRGDEILVADQDAIWRVPGSGHRPRLCVRGRYRSRNCR
jgi:hypothetical protein